MTAMTEALAFVLHSRPYRETSLLVELFGSEHGRLGVVAKGARRGRAPWAALLQPFTPLRLALSGRSSLKTLTHVEALAPPYRLTGVAWCCACYLNELLIKLFQPEDAHPVLLHRYHATLAQLAGTQDALAREAALRDFETVLLQEMGYGLPTHDVTGRALCASARYHFDPAHGFHAAADGAYSGATLLALLRAQRLVDRAQFAEAKALLRRALDFHLAGQVLHSRKLLQEISTYRRVA